MWAAIVDSFSIYSKQSLANSRSPKDTVMAKLTKSNGRRKRAPWTKDDLRELKMHSKSKTPVAKIAKAMRRSEGAIRQKAMMLDIGVGHRR